MCKLFVFVYTYHFYVCAVIRVVLVAYRNFVPVAYELFIVTLILKGITCASPAWTNVRIRKEVSRNIRK